MDYADMLKLLTDTRDEYEREMRRGVFQRDLTKAHDALVGLEAIGRLEQRMRLVQAAENERLAEIEAQIRKAFHPRRIQRVSAPPRPKLLTGGG